MCGSAEQPAVSLDYFTESEEKFDIGGVLPDRAAFGRDKAGVDWIDVHGRGLSFVVSD